MPRPSNRADVLAHLRDTIACGKAILGAGAGSSFLAFSPSSMLNVSRDRTVCQIRGKGWSRFDHHLQLRPFPHGGKRLSCRNDALRRCQCYRSRHGQLQTRYVKTAPLWRCSLHKVIPFWIDFLINARRLLSF